MWHPINHIPGPLIEVNEKGDVRTEKDKQEKTQHYNTRSGFWYICAYYEGKQKNYYLHRIIAEAVHPNPNRYKFVIHVDSNKNNNAFSNVQWSRLPAASRVNAKLNALQVGEIRKKIKQGGIQKKIAEEFKVSSTLISHIKSGRRWQHLK